MTEITYPIGANVWVRGVLGQTPGKIHASRCVVVVGKREDGTKFIGLSGSRTYICDGDKHHGYAGMWRGTVGILCEQRDACEAELLDAGITCENCRARLGLAPLKKSVSGLATYNALVELDKLNKRKAVLSEKVQSNAEWIARMEDDMAKYAAEPEKNAHWHWKRHCTGNIKNSNKIIEKSLDEIERINARREELLRCAVDVTTAVETTQE